MLFKITIPIEPFKTLAREGVVAQKFGAILEDTKPEMAYFTGNDSGRGLVAVYDLVDGSQVPAVAEPWMLVFDAKIEYSVAISPDELGKANIDEVIKKWL